VSAVEAFGGKASRGRWVSLGANKDSGGWSSTGKGTRRRKSVFAPAARLGEDGFSRTPMLQD